MVIVTSNATIRIQGTKATVRAMPKETLVEVSQGEVRVERTKSGESVVLGTGSWTMVGMEGALEAWETRDDRPKTYQPGSAGPEEALMLLYREGRRWRDIEA